MINAKSLLSKKNVVIIVWIVVLLLAIPAVLHYSSYLNYANSTSTNSSSESAQAQKLVSQIEKTHQSLTIVINGNPIYNSTLAKSTFELERMVRNSDNNVYQTTDPYTDYSNYIDNTTVKTFGSEIMQTYLSVRTNSSMIYKFSYNFYINWKISGFNENSIQQAANSSGYNGSNYEKTFISNVKSSFNKYSGNGEEIVANSIICDAKNSSFNLLPVTSYILKNVNFYAYGNSTSLSEATAYYISNLTGFHITWNLVYSVINFSNPGNGYVTNFALLDAPGFLVNQTVSPNHKIFIVSVEFNTPSGYEFKNGSSLAQEFYPTLSKYSASLFGKDAIVTGNGAIAYQTAQVTAKSGFAFGLIFIFLLIAIFITLVSYWASILGLIFVGISLLLGYVSVYITGFLIGNVSFIVNYTLTAVILGVSTDYLVFLIARYRQELREGREYEEALDIAINRAGKAVIISGITVAVTLLTFSLVPSFFDWGVVLFQAIIYTVILQTTLLPVAMKLLSKRLIMKLGSKPLEENHHRRSVFYKTTSFSSSKKFAVAAVIIILGAAGGYFFFTAPTTYNFNTGLPQSLSSVHGLNEIEDNFGDGVIFPTYIIYKSNFNSENLTHVQINTLEKTAKKILSYKGVSSVEGPYVSGMKITNNSISSSFAIDNGKYYLFIVSLSNSPYSSQSISTVSSMRANDSFIVGGITSSVIDQQSTNVKTYGELEIFIVVAIFLILLASFRKLRYPIISITGTFFSISWSTFILYLISNYLLHIQLIYLIPIILFIILFSLGNDYTVFISSRIIEEVKKENFEEGLRKGMVGSAKTVTSLGLILAISLGSLAFIPVAFLEELGLAFVISLVIDTFVIRTFYFPSMLSIFHRNGEKQ